MLATSWVYRGNSDSALLWLGFGVFTGSAAIIVGSLSIGPRPLRSLGVGAWFLTMATGGVIIWLGRGAVEPDDQRGQVKRSGMLAARQMNCFSGLRAA